jgi:RimJ/RimL family protein N-acetyltransferase
MADADIAVSAAGSTCWELCFMGLPSLLLDTAENQVPLAQALQRQGCAIHVGDKSVSPQALSGAIKSLVGSEELRLSLSEQSHKLVDGKGASRVVSVLQGIDRLVVRPVNADDCRLIWELANDPEVRAASFLVEPIPWETHVRWFAQKMADEQTLLLIAQDDEGIPIGQVRFDLDGCDAELHVSLFKERRGNRLSVPAIHAALQKLFATRHCKSVHAYVKPENVASVKLFESAGFTKVGTKIVREHSALHFIRAKSHPGIR